MYHLIIIMDPLTFICISLMFQQLILITYILQSRLIYNNAINLQNN